MSEQRPARSQSWQRWRMDELARLPAAIATTAADSQLLQRKASLQAAREQQRDEARHEGHAAGFAAGRELGYQQGLVQGRAKGEQELLARRQELEAPFANLLTGLREALGQLDADIGDTLADLALAAGRKLAGDALDAKPEHVRNLIRELLREEPLFNGQPDLRLHPDDQALLDASLLAELAAAGWQLRTDPTLERGDCRLTGAEGELNATREARWQALLARVRRHGSGPLKPRAARATRTRKP